VVIGGHLQLDCPGSPDGNRRGGDEKRGYSGGGGKLRGGQKKKSFPFRTFSFKIEKESKKSEKSLRQTGRRCFHKKEEPSPKKRGGLGKSFLEGSDESRRWHF